MHRALLVAALLLAAVSIKGQVETKSAKPDAAPQWRLTWSDEFNGPDGSAPDTAKWNIITDGHPPNTEQEFYTDRRENVRVEKGNLVLEGRREKRTNANGEEREYTSGRVDTRGKFDQQYGRFEARILFPGGQGIWPAFWMMGNDFAKVHWPACGEIDIMEYVGNSPFHIQATLHGPEQKVKGEFKGRYKLPDGSGFANAWHVYAMEWRPDEMSFYVDGALFKTLTRRDVDASAKWVYDHPFFLLFNLAVGGRWPGPADATTPLPAKMLIDWVRVYEPR